MNPQVDKVVRRTTMVATAVASYFLLTADYGPEPNVLDPVRSDSTSVSSLRICLFFHEISKFLNRNRSFLFDSMVSFSLKRSNIIESGFTGCCR